MNPPEHIASRKSRGKRLRFGLKVFFCLSVLLLLLTTVGVHRVYQQHRALSWASRNGADVETNLPTDWQEKPTWLNTISVAFVDPAPTVVFRNVAAVDLGPLAGSRLSSLEIYSSSVYGISTLRHVRSLEDVWFKEVSVENWSGLGALSTLRGLGIVHSNLSDITFVNELVALDSLVLNGTAVRDLGPLRSLTHLRLLELNDSPVSDLTPLGQLANLQWLDLSRTCVSDLRPLRKLKHLEVLLLSETCVRDIFPLASLQSLHQVDLSHTKVNDISALAKQRYLYNLSICGTMVDDLTALRNVSRLGRLSVSDTDVVSVAPLETLHELKYLNLSGTRISDVSPLLKMSSLTYLDLSSASISDVSTLLNMPNLRWVDLRGTQIDEDSFHSLRAALPNCTIDADFPVAEKEKL